MNRILAAAASLGLLAVVSAAAADNATQPAPPPPEGLAVATFASGCFWCTESDFDKVAGVVSTTSGYTGGKTVGPSYQAVSAGGTGHAEALQVVYDPKKVSYETLLDTYWHNVDPVDGRGQFCDKGNQYRPAIFTHDPEQARLAAESKAKLAASGRFHEPIVVQVQPAGVFYMAEDYHQDYHTKNPAKYKFYRWNCGRDQRLEQIWGKAGS